MGCAAAGRAGAIPALQMRRAGFQTNEINLSLEDLRGLKNPQLPGFGGEVLARAGATTVNLPRQRDFQLACKKRCGSDATDWVSAPTTTWLSACTQGSHTINYSRLAGALAVLS